MIAAVEGGGTTWRCALARISNPLEPIESASFETREPDETLAAIGKWLADREPFEALGIASFGPIDPQESSPTYGYITATPKPGWQNTDVVGTLKKMLVNASLPIKFDTDVNAPAFAEAKATVPHPSSLAYVTVGTGVGVGLYINGAPVHGLLHPEAGHISCPQLPHDNLDDTGLTSLNCRNWFEVEAMCATRALARRAQVQPDELESLDEDHPVWEAAAHYLAAMCANLMLVVSPQRIILSGGVMQRASLFPKIRHKVVTMLNGYIPAKRIEDPDYISPSRWGNQAGIVGALALAKEGYDERNPAGDSSSQS